MNSENTIKQATYFLSEQLRFSVAAINIKYTSVIKEIRLKTNYPICIVTANEKLFLKYNGGLSDTADSGDLCIVQKIDMEESVSRLLNFSAHAFQNEMKNGYVTIKGGHRVGICATAATSTAGDILSVRNVSSLNIRIAREIKGSAGEIVSSVFSQNVPSILIAGEPSSGKTTVLRDLARSLASNEFGYKRVCIIDERGEIAATCNGISSNDLGACCDVLDGYPKAQGMMIALRALSPDVIICDEIGGEDDIRAIENIVNSGVKIIATIHSDSLSKLSRRPQFARLMNTAAFDFAVILDGKENPGRVKEILSLKKYWR